MIHGNANFPVFSSNKANQGYVRGKNGARRKHMFSHIIREHETQVVANQLICRGACFQKTFKLEINHTTL